MAELIPPGPWHVEPELWDKVIIADDEWPGLAKVKIKRANKWDEKKAKGSHGGKREYTGADLAKITITIVYWTADDHAQIVSTLLPKVEPTPGKKKIDALSLQHAVAIARNVSAFTVDDVDGPDVEGGIGTITITGTEHREPDNKNAKGAAGGPPRNANCDALAKYHGEMTAAYMNATINANAARGQLAAGGKTASSLPSDATFGDIASSIADYTNDPDTKALYQYAIEQEGAAAGYKNNADNAYLQMQAMGCLQTKPSGDPANTQP